MAYKAILHVDGERRELLSFDIRYFKARTDLFSDWLKDNQLRLLDELSLIAKADPYAFIATKGVPFGGLLELTMASTDNDDQLYDWFIPSKLFGIRIKHGVIEFYDDDDDYIPFRRIEFWDAWVVDISETMCSTGNKPMVLSLRISPATVRYNRSVVVQQSWWLTDINESTANHADEENEPVVSRIFWKGEEDGTERKDMMLNHLLTLEVEFSEGTQGDEVELTVRQSKGRRIKGQSKEFTVSGTIDENRMMVIHDFKVECDFKEDNQDFENIEFYHNERKVAEFKENFGWTKIQEGNLTKVFVNSMLVINKIAIGCTEEDYKMAMNNQFKRTLELSSEGLVTGKVFFSGTATTLLPQVVPSLNIKVGEKDVNGEGYTIFTSINIATSIADKSDLLMELSIVSMHELLHTLRLDHPFERVQTPDSALSSDGIDHFKTTMTTDPLIYYNIMNYDDKYINGKRLGDLWKNRLPDYITKQQLELILNEIDLQSAGNGCNTRNMPTIPVHTEEFGDDIPEASSFDVYWVYCRPGNLVK